MVTHAISATETRDDDLLISRHVVLPDNSRDPTDARVMPAGYSVWILIDALNAAGGKLDAAAEEYAIDVEVMRAAVAYYSRHRAVIDAKIIVNAAFFGIEP